MPVVVYRPPPKVDDANFERFRSSIVTAMRRRGSVVVDCSGLTHVSIAAMRVLESAARDGSVTLVNASPVVRFLASVFAAGTVSQPPPSPPLVKRASGM